MSERRDFFKESTEKFVQNLVPSGVSSFFDFNIAHKTAPIQSFQKRNLLVSSGDPINNSGAPFGAAISQLIFLTTESRRGYLVFGHAGNLHNLGFEDLGDGLTVVEFFEGRPLWTSLKTRRWHAREEIPSVCEEFDEEKKLRVKSRPAPKFGAVRKLVATPWGSVLVLTTDKGMFELSLDTNSMRFCGHFADHYLESLLMNAKNGKAFELYFSDASKKCYRYTSHQFFDSRILNHNHRLLSCGKIEEIEKLNELDAAALPLAPELMPLQLSADSFQVETETFSNTNGVRVAKVWIRN